MRILSIISSLIFVTATLASCNQFKGMSANNQAEEQKKMDEVAAQIAEKLALQAKKDSEDKALKEKEIEDEVQKRLAAKEAAETQVQPTAEPAKEPVKVVERVIVKEVPAKPRETVVAQAERPSGYLRVFTDSQLSGKNMSLSFGNNMNTTDGTAFKDNITSIEYRIPSGWQVAVYEDSGYSKKRYVIKSGSGSIGHLPPYINDNISSIRWEKSGQ